MDLLLLAIIFVSGMFAGATLIFWLTMPKSLSAYDYYRNASNPFVYFTATGTAGSFAGCDCGCNHAEGCPGEGAKT